VPHLLGEINSGHSPGRCWAWSNFLVGGRIAGIHRTANGTSQEQGPEPRPCLPSQRALKQPDTCESEHDA
jgi:hypothetical protein